MSFFTNGGAEANENAIKLARWYTSATRSSRATARCHGATAGAITLTGDPAAGRPSPVFPASSGCRSLHLPLPCGYHDPCPVCTGAPHLEEILQYEGPQTVAAVMLETITGTNGVIVPPDGYLQSIRRSATATGSC